MKPKRGSSEMPYIPYYCSVEDPTNGILIIIFKQNGILTLTDFNTWLRAQFSAVTKGCPSINANRLTI